MIIILLRACEKVKANKGAPGIDGMTVNELFGHVSNTTNN